MVELFDGIDILFANAGIRDFKTLLEMEDANRHDQFDVDLTGTADAVRAVAPHIVHHGGGQIILTSSTQGRAAVSVSPPGEERGTDDDRE